MKAISFYAPHWELVFRGILAIDGFGVKTRNNPAYSYRGPVLCYTAVKGHPGPMARHGFIDVSRGVVGVANLADIRVLTDSDKRTLFRGYNNLGPGRAEYEAMIDDKYAIFPMDYGYFFDQFYKFPQPFVPPKQHMFGPVGAIPMYPEIEQQLPKWART